jgi:hypothetical protein
MRQPWRALAKMEIDHGPTVLTPATFSRGFAGTNRKLLISFADTSVATHNMACSLDRLVVLVRSEVMASVDLERKSHAWS